MNPQQGSFAACAEAAEDIVVRYQPKPTRIDAVLDDEAVVYELSDYIDACFAHADRIEIRFRARMCQSCGRFTRRPEKVKRSNRWHVVCPACALTLSTILVLEKTK